MLGYQHFYHAGNFADVHKHALLTAVLTALRNRAPKIFLIDTHAGRGFYDLSASPEHVNGIAKLRSKDIPALKDYLALVTRRGDAHYPGSPQIAKDILRPQDKTVFCELHPQEHAALQERFPGARQADGFQTLLESVPPPERDGIVRTAHRKWPRGVFFLWYPLLAAAPHEAMLDALAQTGIPEILTSEIALPHVPGEGFAMYGSGVALINSPLPLGVLSGLTKAVAEALGAEARTHPLLPPGGGP